MLLKPTSETFQISNQGEKMGFIVNVSHSGKRDRFAFSIRGIRERHFISINRVQHPPKCGGSVDRANSSSTNSHSSSLVGEIWTFDAHHWKSTFAAVLKMAIV
jgi:hypothetical protein